MPAETGEAVIGKNIFPENAGMGTGEYESAGTRVGGAYAYAGCTCVAFFYSFQVPRLGKEFDLLQIKDDQIVNIELKSGDTVYTADKVAELIQKYDMQNDCVITSFDYNMLKRVKELTDDIQVGYILSIAYGDFYSMDDVDFFSMNASFLSKQIVDAIHNSGKQVYAWTVNNATSIKNLTNKGVDNIITDDPVLARETIYSRDTSETLVNMAKYVFNQ